ncbi:hypothetical protein L2E82_51543 [Cichorium intybus]|nr:hypothetical protein L2E82_51543 [Cichorium intybus]
MRIQSRRSGRMVEESMDSLGIDSRWLDIRVTTGREEEGSTTELLATSCKGKDKTTFQSFSLLTNALASLTQKISRCDTGVSSCQLDRRNEGISRRFSGFHFDGDINILYHLSRILTQLGRGRIHSLRKKEVLAP